MFAFIKMLRYLFIKYKTSILNNIYYKCLKKVILIIKVFVFCLNKMFVRELVVYVLI